jgi:site-specific DNA-methyltransferase (adenine-specific)/modification methylase
MNFEKVSIGAATLYRGDCMDVLPFVSGVDAVITDPPYGIGESSKNHQSRNRVKGGKAIVSPDYGKSDWDKNAPAPEVLQALIAASPKCILWGGNYFDLPPSSKWLVWDKLNSGDFADCELAWTNLPGAVRTIRHMWNGMLRDSERGVPRVHPTQKPVKVMGWCIEQAGECETIFDPYMGSGTTGVAAIQLGRRFIGVEREAKYFDIACARIEQAVSQGQLFVPEVPPQEQAGLFGEAA